MSVTAEKNKYRILAGQHIQSETLDKPCPKCKGQALFKTSVGDTTCPSCKGSGLYTVERKYRAGDIFDSAIDLCSLFNLPGSNKFERIVPTENPYLSQPAPGETEAEFKTRMERLKNSTGVAQADHPQGSVDDTPPPPPPPNSDPFEDMSEKELRAYANEEEIDVKGARNRGDLLKVIRSSLQLTTK